MKKYALIFDGKLVNKYESDDPMSFGGPWKEAVSIEIPDNINFNRVKYENGELSEKPKNKEETDEETNKTEFTELVQYMKDFDFSTIQDSNTKAFLKKVARSIIRLSR